MSSLQQQKAAGANATTAANDGSNIFYQAQKLGSVSSPLPTPLPLLEQISYDNYSHGLKWDETTLVQRMAALKLEAQKRLLNEFILQKAQLQNSPITCPIDIHLRTSKTPSQRNRELYKTALCDFWSAGVPCRFGDRCWFAHGPHELRIARFVYPSLNPYDYEVRMNGPPSNYLQHVVQCMTPAYPRRLWNVEQSCPVPAMVPVKIEPMGPNLPMPIGHERKYCRISPIQENVTSKECWHNANHGTDGDSGFDSPGNRSSPETNARGNDNMDGAIYSPPGGTDAAADAFNSSAVFGSNIIPQHLQQPLNTLTNDPECFQRGEAYNRWMNTGSLMHSANAEGTNLEQASWWPDTINSAYPYINCFPTIQSNSGAVQANEFNSMNMELKGPTRSEP